MMVGFIGSARTLEQIQKERNALIADHLNRETPNTIGGGIAALGKGLVTGYSRRKLDDEYEATSRAGTQAFEALIESAYGGGAMSGNLAGVEALTAPSADVTTKPIASPANQSLRDSVRPAIALPLDSASYTGRDLAMAIQPIETGGLDDPYSALGPVNEKTGDRPYGYSQIMGANIPRWSEKYLGKRMSPDEYLAGGEAVQTALTEAVMEDMLGRHGNAKDVFSEWHSGVPLAEAQGRADALGTRTPDYVEKAYANLGGSSSAPAPMQAAAPQQQQPARNTGPTVRELMKVASNPGLNEQQRSVVNALLTNALKQPEGMTAYQQEQINIANQRLGIDQSKYARESAQDASEAAAPDVKGEGDLRKEVTSLNKTFATTSQAYQRIQSATDTPTGDVALIFAYMKMLDPTSTVRESEYATIENIGSVPTRIWNMFEKAKSGQGVAPGTRKEIKENVSNIMKAQIFEYNDRAKYYRGLAGQYDYDPDRIIEFKDIPDSILEKMSDDELKRLAGYQ